MKNMKKFKIAYLPLTKVNWSNETLETARKDALAFLQTLSGVETVGGSRMIALESEAIAELERMEEEKPDLIAAGDGLDTDFFIRGNPLKIKLDAGCDKMRQEIIGNGWEHHYTLCYGDQTGNLAALCKMLDIQYTIVK